MLMSVIAFKSHHVFWHWTRTVVSDYTNLYCCNVTAQSAYQARSAPTMISHSRHATTKCHMDIFGLTM